MCCTRSIHSDRRLVARATDFVIVAEAEDSSAGDSSTYWAALEAVVRMAHVVGSRSMVVVEEAAESDGSEAAPTGAEAEEVCSLRRHAATRRRVAALATVLRQAWHSQEFRDGSRPVDSCCQHGERRRRRRRARCIEAETFRGRMCMRNIDVVLWPRALVQSNPASSKCMSPSSLRSLLLQADLWI